MSKIVPIFLGLFFAVSVTPAVAGDDNDCVSIPEEAGFPYKGRTYCCNLADFNLPEGAHNAKYGDVIPWNANKGTVRKCLGGLLHDDEWGDEYVSVSSTAHEFDDYDFVTNNELMRYSKFNSTAGAWSTPVSKKCWGKASIGNSVNGKTFCDFRVNVLGGHWLATFLFYDYPGEIRLCNTYEGYEKYYDYITETTGYPIKVYPAGTITKGFYATDEEGYDTGAYVCEDGYDNWVMLGFCKESLGKYRLSQDETYPTNFTIVEGGADNGYHDCLLLTEDSFQETQPVAVQNVDAPIINETQESSESGIKYGYQQCSSNDDCTQEKLSEFLNNKPYLHSTDWYCVEQTPGNKVCAVKACEDEYEPKLGYCAKKVVENIASGNGSAGSANANSPSNKIVVTERHDTDEKSEQIKKLTEKIDKTYTELQGLTKNLSQWKNTEGKFNTARLASDSTAAVVLGTVGGVVTAKLVKKSQVKKGFESLQCYIGGQPIAAYDDEVTIGR